METKLSPLTVRQIAMIRDVMVDLEDVDMIEACDRAIHGDAEALMMCADSWDDVHNGPNDVAFGGGMAILPRA